MLGQQVVTVNGRTITIPNSVPPEVRAKLLQQAQGIQAGGETATPTAAVAGQPAAGGADASAAQRKQKMEARLKKLAQLKFNRLPSQILETWAKPTVAAKDDPNEDLPPAPAEATLYSDVRLKIATDQLERDFTLGNWDRVSEFLKQLPEANAKTLYSQLLTAATGSQDNKLQGATNGSQFDPRQLQALHMTYEDLFKLAEIAPTEIEKTHVSLFGTSFAKSISQGKESADLITKMKAELEKEKPVFTKRQMARVFFQCGLTIPAGEFLPELDEAKKENDHEALNLLSRHYLAIYAKEKESKDLEKAWHVTQAILASQDVDKDERKQALSRAVTLSSQVNKQLGQKWLNDSFVAQPEIGMEVLGAIGADTAKSMKDCGRSSATRLARLKLQNDAVKALLKVSNEQAKNWQPQLNLLAQNWLREATVSYSDDQSTHLGPSMQRDRYGNIFYFDDDGMNGQRMNNFRGRLQAINTKELLDVRPSDQWMEMVDETLLPKFDAIQAQLYLKVSEQDLALPFIEKLAAAYPKKAKKLVDEFITVWTKNHNPNSDRGRTNAYMYMYGFESRAQSIPLTRSKQERNLSELADIVKRLEKLVPEDLDEDKLARAFFVCHSTAEVYKIKSIENVFGPIENMKPKTLASITSRMRSNLATMWRDANVQKDKKTKRKKKDIEAEVIGGYETAGRIIADSLAKNPDEWRLVATQASLLHDENNYRADAKNSTAFSKRRNAAMELFNKAAKMYVSSLEYLEKKDYKTDAFDTWFYASLGACDLGLITDKHQADSKQPALIRQALESIEGEEKNKWHMDRFANLLFNRLSSAKPQLKFKYLDKGFEIVGDNEQAAEARKVHDYYKDLVTEIKIESHIEGSDRVGTGKPFGVHVSLRHTKEIERESGGFGRYLQNQNGSGYFSYNYGRPTNDYRDKFDEGVRESFEEQFEVLSVTFQKPDVQSIPAGEPGWRITPYAYVLLKAKGPEVDKVPPFRLDLDFLDTSGYAILPVESATLPIDASASEAEARPFKSLEVTQILDERQAEDGKLILEIKGQAQGLVPDLDEIMDVDFKDFEVVSIDNEGASVSQFDEEESLPTIISDRNWVVSLEAKKGLPAKPTAFNFPVPNIELKEVVYQRYVDADLAIVTPSISLEEKYGKTSYGWIIGLIAAVGLLAFLVVGLIIWFATRSGKSTREAQPELNGNLSPFAAISLLQDIYSNNGLNETKKVELKQSINRLEEHYFGKHNGDESPDLASEVKKWTKQSRVLAAR